MLRLLWSSRLWKWKMCTEEMSVCRVSTGLKWLKRATWQIKIYPTNIFNYMHIRLMFPVLSPTFKGVSLWKLALFKQMKQNPRFFFFRICFFFYFHSLNILPMRSKLRNRTRSRIDFYSIWFADKFFVKNKLCLYTHDV